MPGRFEEALDAARAYLDASGTEEERERLERITELREAVAGWSARLGELPGTATIDHNDLHPWNMLVGEGGELRGVRFYDWGDSVVAHPFASMLIPLGFVERRLLETSSDRRPLLRVRDAYLDGFRDLATHPELVETLEVACRLARVARALTWTRALAGQKGPADERWASAPLESLTALLSDSYLGGG
jgi:Ser/Thr protein kinase RdoA (MazF antagonist)